MAASMTAPTDRATAFVAKGSPGRKILTMTEPSARTKGMPMRAISTGRGMEGPNPAPTTSAMPAAAMTAPATFRRVSGSRPCADAISTVASGTKARKTEVRPGGTRTSVQKARALRAPRLRVPYSRTLSKSRPRGRGVRRARTISQEMIAAAPSRAAAPQKGGSSALLKRMAMGLPPAPSTKSAKAIKGAWLTGRTASRRRHGALLHGSSFGEDLVLRSPLDAHVQSFRSGRVHRALSLVYVTTARVSIHVLAARGRELRN